MPVPLPLDSHVTSEIWGAELSAFVYVLTIVLNVDQEALSVCKRYAEPLISGPFRVSFHSAEKAPKTFLVKGS